MIRISKLADYATVIMNFLAAKPEQMLSAVEIARQVHIALPTVSKVLKLLADAQLVVATRGSNGGYRLACSPDRIKLTAVITAIDGYPAVTECSQTASLCAQDGVCAIKHNWRLINHMILGMLQNLTIADMAKPLAQHPLIAQNISGLTLKRVTA